MKSRNNALQNTHKVKYLGINYYRINMILLWCATRVRILDR